MRWTANPRSMVRATLPFMCPWNENQTFLHSLFAQPMRPRPPPPGPQALPRERLFSLFFLLFFLPFFLSTHVLPHAAVITTTQLRVRSTTYDVRARLCELSYTLFRIPRLLSLCFSFFPAEASVCICRFAARKAHTLPDGVLCSPVARTKRRRFDSIRAFLLRGSKPARRHRREEEEEKKKLVKD